MIMSDYKKQKSVKPQIEDRISELVKEDYQLKALDFVGFIRTNKMTPSWASLNSWKVNYKGKVLCYIRTAGTAHYHNLDDGSWHIAFAVYSDFVYEVSISDEAIKMVWDKVRHCTRCANCIPANQLTINGKVFDNVCHQWLVIKNPNAEELACVKKLVEAIRQSISDIDKQEPSRTLAGAQQHPIESEHLRSLP